MGWTNPTTQTDGTTIDDATWNTDLVDNLFNIRKAFDITGKFYRGSTEQIIATGMDTPVVWETAAWNQGMTWSSGSNPSRVTVPTTGVYELSGMVGWQVNGTGYRQISYKINNSGPFYDLVAVPGSSAIGIESSFHDQLSLQASDYVELYVYQNSGGNLTINKDVDGTRMNLRFIGRPF